MGKKKSTGKTATQHLETTLHPGLVALVLLLVVGLFVAVFASQRSTYFGSDASSGSPKRSQSNTVMDFDAAINYQKQTIYVTADVTPKSGEVVEKVVFYYRRDPSDTNTSNPWKLLGTSKKVNKKALYASEIDWGKVVREAGLSRGYQFTANVYYKSKTNQCTGNPSYTGGYFVQCVPLQGGKSSEIITMPAQPPVTRPPTPTSP